jgi:uncharacterized protein
MQIILFRSTLGVGIASAALIACFGPVHASQGSECHVGSYKLENGGIVDIAPIEGDGLRWRTFDGKVGELKPQPDGGWQSFYGWTGRPDGIAVELGACSDDKIRFAEMEARRLSFDVIEGDFTGRDGATLKGRLVLPDGHDKVPVVVLIHGAERDAARRFNFLQRLFPAVGIGVFVYDKRGTGKSGGIYTQDFDLLADDAVAAMATARKLAAKRAGRVGYQGASQGGWVAPLAANRAPADFVIVSFGLAVSILDEDLQQMEMELADKGYPPEIIAKAHEIARAAGKIFASNFKSGYAEFDAVRAQYRGESWYKDVNGHITWLLLPHEEAAIRAEAPKYDWGTPFRYDPIPTLKANKAPQLWILGGRDFQAPAKETSRRIRTLIAAGKPFTLAVYPQAEHGMTLFETAPDGSRLSTRFAEGYFAMMRDFIANGEIGAGYGDATISR